MAAEEKWYFTKDQLANTPSKKSGYDADKELSCRQQAANFIQDMGQRLQVNQLCINTAIVYMHRFYMFHSFTRFHRNAMAAAALFLAAKVEEQPRKLEYVIKVAQMCLHREQPPPDVKSEVYIEQAQELVVNENILLQTLGFDVAIDHPHTHVVRCCHLVRASKDLAQTSYFMASNSLHLTTMCLQYKPTVVACFCIHLACKWSNWEIPQSTEGKPWFWYMDKSVTQELLEQLTEEFLAIFDKCPSRLKKKITSLSSTQHPSILSAFTNEGDKKRNGEGSSSNPTSISGLNFAGLNEEMKKKQEFLRHHPDYKKHHVPHHGRMEGSSLSKSSCMFGPPTRPVPPTSHASSGNVSNASNSSVLRPASSSKSAMVEPLIGKPEHLHHRPRRPDEKHPRNHELVSSQYKKYDKVSSGVISDFSSVNISNNNNNNSNNNNSSNSSSNSFSNRACISSNNNSYLNVSLGGHAQPNSNAFLQQQQQTQQQIPVQSQVASQSVSLSGPGQSTEVLTTLSSRLTGNVDAGASIQGIASEGTLPSTHPLSSLNKHQLLTAVPTVVTLPHTSVTNMKVKSPVLLPPPIKVERSIFSPEKSASPTEITSHPSPPAQQAQTEIHHGIPSNSNVITSHPSHIANISTAVTRKKTDTITTESPILMVQPKSEDAFKAGVLTQMYHTTISETLKSDTMPKEEKPPVVVKHQEIAAATHGAETLVGQTLVNVPVSATVNNPTEELHTKEQKKKKKKHKEHKEKHKDKHKHKHKNRDPEPIVITIPKEKLSLPQQAPEQGLLKIKIAKDKIATSISSAPPTGLKIKIPKEKIKESRKRDRSEEQAPGVPGKLHRPNGTTLQVNNVIDIMECSDSENDKPNNISLGSINSPPIDLNDACPSFDDILRPSTLPGMPDVLLGLFQSEVSNISSGDTAATLESKEPTNPYPSASAPPVAALPETQNQLGGKFTEPNRGGRAYKGMPNENNVQKTVYYGRQNGGYGRSRYAGGRRRGRGYHLSAARIPPPHPQQSAYMGANNWDALRHGAQMGIPPPPIAPPGYLLGHHTPAMHPSHFFPASVIVPNFPPPPPLPDDPPPQQPPPPPPE